MLLYNIKLVFRNLQRNKLYSFLSITGFAIGFAVCIVITLYAYNEYTVDHCYPNYQRMYRLVNEREKKSKIDYNLNHIIADQNPEIEAICPLELIPDIDFNVKTEKEMVKANGLAVTNNNFFKFFSIRVTKGLSNEPFQGRETAVITESFARKLFTMSEEPLGKTITIDNYINATISAVIEDFPINTSIKANILLNIENEDYRYSTYCSNNDHCINPVNHLLLLDRNTNPEEFTLKLNKNISTYLFAIDSIGLQPLQEIYFNKTISDNQNLKGSENTILVIIAIGILIILLSTINYLNYNFSMQYTKLREVGIKRINGAGFRQLVGYCLTDVSVGILISVDLALILVGLFLPYINGLIGKQLDLNVLCTPGIIIFSLIVMILIILVNSIIPMYILSKFNISTFFSGKKQERGKMIGRNFLTTFQFIVAITLLCCVTIILKQLRFAQETDLGFGKEHLLRLSIPWNSSQQQVLKLEINKLPFVLSSSLSHGTPGDINLWMGNGDTLKKNFNLACITVDEDFVKTMGIELLDGRWFLGGDAGKTCIMNQEAVKWFEWNNIEGKRYNNGREGGYQVVGLVKDFHIESLHQAIVPTCILSCSNDKLDELYNLNIRITPGDVESKIQQIQRVWSNILPNDPMDFTFYDELFDAMYRKEKLLFTIIMFFSVIAVILSCMGVLGQIFQTCINRTKEIGIRKVNGASTWIILWLLNYDFVKLILIAFVIASPIAYCIMDKWMQNFAYKTCMSWWVFVLAGVIVLIISFVTVTLQSWRAANRNPVEALRYE